MTQKLNGGATGLQLADWLGTIRAIYSYTGGNEGSSGAHAPFGEAYAYQYGYPGGFTGQGGQGWGQGGDGNMPDTTYWFPERQYRSAQGRWLSPDPAGMGAVDPSNPQSWNRYSYVLNNPLANIDPDGLACVYWNDNGTAVDTNGIDNNSTQDECWDTGGYWAPGYVGGSNWAQIDPNTGTASIVSLTSQNQGFIQETTAGYLPGGAAFSQDASYVDSSTSQIGGLSPYGQAAALAISKATANFPNICAAGGSASATILKTNLSALGSLGRDGFKGQLSGQLPFGKNHTVGSVDSQAQGTPLIPSSSSSPINSPINAQMNGRYVLSVSVEVPVSVLKQRVSLYGWANLSGMGDPNCP